MADHPVDISQLTLDERLALLEDLEASLGMDEECLEVDDATLAELRRRLDSDDATVEWSDIRTTLASRLGPSERRQE